jgi:hypothetical protein
MQHYRRGSRSYNAGDFAAALTEFQRAYQLSEAPGLLFNLGQAARLNHDPERALFYYQTYLRELPSAPNHKDVNHFITVCERALRAAPPRATAMVVPRESRPRAEEPPAEAAPRTALPSARAPVPALGPRRGLLAAGVTVGGVGLFGLVTAIVLGTQSESAEGELARLSAEGGAWDARHQALYDTGQRQAWAATALYAVGGVALATGVVLTIVGARPQTSRLLALGKSGVAWQCEF